MAIIDMFGRPIEKGDLVLLTGNQARPFVVQDVAEPSNLVPPGQVPLGSLKVLCAAEFPLPNPNRTPNLQVTDVVIVMKGTEKAGANPKQ